MKQFMKDRLEDCAAKQGGRKARFLLFISRNLIEFGHDSISDWFKQQWGWGPSEQRFVKDVVENFRLEEVKEWMERYPKI